MHTEWITYLFFTLLSIVIQGFFALFEMSVVSFDKMRLQYFVSLGDKRALRIDYLLKRPSRLFGTTLIGINSALQIGSECSRRFYESIHLNPDWAPISQVLLVVIFAELAPMFAARRHPQQLALALAPVMVLIAKLLQPIIWTFDSFSHFIHRLIGKTKEVPLFLSREEVKLAFESREKGEDELNSLVRQIFQLKNLKASQLMTPIQKVPMIASTATLAEAKHHLSIHYEPFIPLFHRHHHNIIAIANLRDLLRTEESQKVFDGARSPWFVAKEASILEILDQFRRNGQSVAVILNHLGQACGLLTLDQIVASIFGEESKTHSAPDEVLPYVERTLPAEMKISDFNREFRADLPYKEGETLRDLIRINLDHAPALGESVKIGRFSFTIIDQSVRKIKTLTVHTLSD